MSIGRLVPPKSQVAGLSDEANKVILTVGCYGGKRGMLLGGTMLNPSIGGSGNLDTNTSIYASTGLNPAIRKWMYLDPTQSFYINAGIAAQATADYEAAIAACIAHWEAGGIIQMGAMLTNLVTGGDWADRSRSDITCVTHLLEGSPNTVAFDAWRAFLNRLAYTLNTRLVSSKGVRIPVIWHWFGECNGSYDYMPGEGLLPGTQVSGRVITALSRDPGGWWNLTFQARAGEYVPFVPGPGGIFQVEGSSNNDWNGNYNVRSWVSGPAGDTPGTGQSITITAWRGRGMPNPSGTLDVSGGTTIAYPASGAWPAGRDRAAALMELLRQSVRYLRDIKGVTTLISAMAPFPEQYWSTKESSVDRFGRTFEYSNWNPGDEFVRMSGFNAYRPNSSPSFDLQSLRDSIIRHRTLHGFKPMLANELGFAQESEWGSGPSFRTQAGFWPREWAVLCTQYPFLSGVSFWSDKFIPAPGDAAFQGFVDTVRGPSCITLERFKRLV